MDALLAVCLPGNTGADLYRAWQDAGNREPRLALAHGLGLGAEPPLIGLGRGQFRDARRGHGPVRPIVGDRRGRRWMPRARDGENRQCAADDADAQWEVMMGGHRAVFNHVGICVTDRDRSRRFYEELLGFQFWWELEPPDEGTDELLQLDAPVRLHATYLVRDGLVLELLDYSGRTVRLGPSGSWTTSG